MSRGGKEEGAEFAVSLMDSQMVQMLQDQFFIWQIMSIVFV